MPNYDYGNARLRAMKSRLLTRPELERLAEAVSLAGLVSALVKTAYRKPVEAALTRFSGMDCIAHALREDLVDTFKKARSFFRAEAEAAVDTYLSSYDIQNLKTVLRGLSRNVPPSEILNSLLPIGMLSNQQLSDLARSPGPRGVIDALASLNLPQAQPLLRLRSSRPGAETQEMELALDQWYYQDALLSSNRKDHLPELLIAALQLEADLTNLLTTLRFVYNPDERKRLHERFGTDDPACLFVGPGKLSFTLLARAGNQETLDLLVSQMAGTAYGPALAAGLEGFATTGRLSEFEKQLKRQRLRWMSGLILRDPLGIGVFLGYQALKMNEINNLRWIAQGISLQMAPAAIRAGLEYAG